VNTEHPINGVDRLRLAQKQRRNNNTLASTRRAVYNIRQCVEGFEI